MNAAEQIAKIKSKLLEAESEIIQFKDGFFYQGIEKISDHCSGPYRHGYYLLNHGRGVAQTLLRFKDGRLIGWPVRFHRISNIISSYKSGTMIIGITQVKYNITDDGVMHLENKDAVQRMMLTGFENHLGYSKSEYYVSSVEGRRLSKLKKSASEY
jgi:hypothetical protein